MSRYRLEPTVEQASILLRHCSDARYVWNLCVEQRSWWRPGRKSAPGYLEQGRQLTAARAANPWLREGSQMVQQQALRDFDQAMKNFFAGTHRRPVWRMKGQSEGFRIVAVDSGDVRRLNRGHAEVKIPKVGWVLPGRSGDRNAVRREVHREYDLPAPDSVINIGTPARLFAVAARLISGRTVPYLGAEEGC